MMKRLLLAGACALVVCGAAGNASALSPYLWLQLGGGQQGDLDYDEARNLGPILGLPFDAGFNGAAALGFVLGAGLRLEAEFGYRSNSVPTTQFEGLVAGDSSIFSLMANAWYDFDFGGPIVPHVGGGIGAARINLDLSDSDSNTGGTPNDSINSSDTVFAYQLGAGAGLKLNSVATLTVDYRFFGTAAASLPSVNAGFGASGQVTSQSVLVGLQFSLGGP